MRYLEIGDTFLYGHFNIEVVEYDINSPQVQCPLCCFDKLLPDGCVKHKGIRGECDPFKRRDSKQVYFVIKNDNNVTKINLTE